MSPVVVTLRGLYANGVHVDRLPLVKDHRGESRPGDRRVCRGDRGGCLRSRRSVSVVKELAENRQVAGVRRAEERSQDAASWHSPDNRLSPRINGQTAPATFGNDNDNKIVSTIWGNKGRGSRKARVRSAGGSPRLSSGFHVSGIRLEPERKGFPPERTGDTEDACHSRPRLSVRRRSTRFFSFSDRSIWGLGTLF